MQVLHCGTENLGLRSFIIREFFVDGIERKIRRLCLDVNDSLPADFWNDDIFEDLIQKPQNAGQVRIKKQ